MKKTMKALGLSALIGLASLTGCKSNDDGSSGKKNECQSQVLEMHESLKDHYGQLNKNNVSFLPNYNISTPQGSTAVEQTLDLGAPQMTFGENEQDVVGHYVFVNDGGAIFKHNTKFKNGLVSDVDSNGNLVDIIGKSLDVMNKSYTINSAFISGNMLSMELVNGANNVVLSDSIADSQETSGVSINGVFQDDSRIMFNGQRIGSQVRLDNIVYKLLADGVLGDVYVAPGQRLSQHIDKPEGLLGFDIGYDGMAGSFVNLAKVSFAGTDEADFEFTNREGIFYDFPLVSNETGAFKWGDDDDDLHFKEGADVADDAFFILNGPNDFTHVLRYDSLDALNNTVTFTDLGTGTRQAVYDSVTKEGSLVVAGDVYKFRVNANGSLTVDLNGDGSYGSDLVKIVEKSGNRISLQEPYAGLKNIRLEIDKKNIDGYKCAGFTGPAEVVNVSIAPVAPTNIETLYVDSSTPDSVFPLWQLVQNPDLKQGMSRYGAFIEQFQNKDVTIEIPESQRKFLVNFYGN